MSPAAAPRRACRLPPLSCGRGKSFIRHKAALLLQRLGERGGSGAVNRAELTAMKITFLGRFPPWAAPRCSRGHTHAGVLRGPRGPGSQAQPPRSCSQLCEHWTVATGSNSVVGEVVTQQWSSLRHRNGATQQATRHLPQEPTCTFAKENAKVTNCFQLQP